MEPPRYATLEPLKSIPELSFEALAGEIGRFQDRLSDDIDIGIIANGAGLIIHANQVRMSGQMVIFDGVDADGREARLIQHYSQVNVQMVAVEKLQAEPQRIGF